MLQKLTEVATEQGFLPVSDFRNEAVQNQERWDPSQDQDAEEQQGESVWENSEFRNVERCEWEPGPDVDEACAVEEEVDHCGELIVLGLIVKMSVPGNCTA